MTDGQQHFMGWCPTCGTVVGWSIPLGFPTRSRAPLCDRCKQADMDTTNGREVDRIHDALDEPEETQDDEGR